MKYLEFRHAYIAFMGERDADGRLILNNTLTAETVAGAACAIVTGTYWHALAREAGDPSFTFICALAGIAIGWMAWSRIIRRHLAPAIHYLFRNVERVPQAWVGALSSADRWRIPQAFNGLEPAIAHAHWRGMMSDHIPPRMDMMGINTVGQCLATYRELRRTVDAAATNQAAWIKADENLAALRRFAAAMGVAARMGTA